LSNNTLQKAGTGRVNRIGKEGKEKRKGKSLSMWRGRENLVANKNKRKKRRLKSIDHSQKVLKSRKKKRRGNGDLKTTVRAGEEGRQEKKGGGEMPIVRNN